MAFLWLKKKYNLRIQYAPHIATKQQPHLPVYLNPCDNTSLEIKQARCYNLRKNIGAKMKMRNKTGGCSRYKQ